jgi:hypothetical protein
MVEKAKRFAERQGVSVSELVTRFLGSVSEEAEAESPVVDTPQDPTCAHGPGAFADRRVAG